MKNPDFLNGNINRLLWGFSYPAIIGMLVNGLYNVVARIFVGRGIGSVGIAAITVATPIMALLMAVGMLIGIGATALISIRLGEQKNDEVERIAGNASSLLIFFSLVLSAIYFIFAAQILRLFGASPEVLPYALGYTHVIMIGAVPGTIAFGMNNFIRAEGNPRIAMQTQIIGALINIVFNYIFIFHFHWGIKGSALATIIGQTVSAIWVLSHFLQGRSKIKLRFKYLKPQTATVLSILGIGFAPFAMQIAFSVQQTILNKTAMHYGGDLALSAVGIIMSISIIFFMPLVGVSQGAQPLIGYNYGACQYDRVKNILKKALLLASSFAVTGFIVIQIFAPQIVGLFSSGDMVLTHLTIPALLTFFAAFFINGVQVIGANYFQAVGKPFHSSILSLSRQVIIFIPFLLILPRFWGIEGVWWTAPIVDVLSVILTSSFLIYEIKKRQTTSVV